MIDLRSRRLAAVFAAVASLVLAGAPAGAQEYRGRVQGTVLDESKAAVPGATIVLRNDKTGVENTRTTDAQGRYLFDYVDPGTYTLSAELQGFKRSEQRNILVQHKSDVTVGLALEVGALAEVVTVEAPPVAVQFNTSSSQLTVENKLVDQLPVAGRNPFHVAVLDPSVSDGDNAENRPYFHQYANAIDAGGGGGAASTARDNNNDILLDGVPLTASYKVSYTPAMDAVSEVTYHKNAVDAEYGHSVGGIISLNMKSGTNEVHGSTYFYGRNPRFNAISDPTLAAPKTDEEDRLRRGTNLKMFGATVGMPLKKNKIFSFTSFERWDDSRPISVVLTVPTEAERRGDFSQSARNGRVRTIFDPWTSLPDGSRTAFPGNVIPQNRLDPTALALLNEMPLPNLPGSFQNWQGSKVENVDYWNLSERIDWHISDKVKAFVRYGQFKAHTYDDNPSGKKLFWLNGSNKYGFSLAGDTVYTISPSTTLDVRGSYYHMTDEFANPAAVAGEQGLEGLWPGNPWYTSLYTSPTAQIYYPQLNTTGNQTLGRNGREFWQHPKGWTGSARLSKYAGAHTLKAGGEFRTLHGKAARFEPINFTFQQNLTANRWVNPDLTGTGNEWATFMLGALEQASAARRIPVQEAYTTMYALYAQDDFKVSDKLTLNLGLRWEYEPGPTDPQNRMSRFIDLTSPIPELQARPPQIPAQAAQLMASKGYSYVFNGAWQFTSEENRNAWDVKKLNLLPRLGVNYKINDKSVARFGYARYLLPTTRVRDSLGDFVEQYTGYTAVTTVLAPIQGVPQARLSDPFPAGKNPLLQATEQSLGRYTNLGGTVNLDLSPQTPRLNDRFNLSLQTEAVGRTVVEFNYFFNYGTGANVQANEAFNLNAVDPAFRYEYRTLLNTQVANPFFNFGTPQTFPGQLRNRPTVALSELLKPYPHYGNINQLNRGDHKQRLHSFEARAQRPFHKGLSFLIGYAYQMDQFTQFFNDIDQYNEVLTWTDTDLPPHRLTFALSWELPFGRERRFLASAPRALDLLVGGWHYTATGRYFTGRKLQFGNMLVTNPDASPILDNPTNDKWFDTSLFKQQDQFTPRNNPWNYDGLYGPSTWQVDMTMTKQLRLSQRVKMELRVEAYNAFNHLNFDIPEMNVTSANFGKVLRKRNDGYDGRQLQFGARVVF